VPPGGFAAWMRSRGHLGGQHKVPRMDNSGRLTVEMSRWFQADFDSSLREPISPRSLEARG
jgi:hypothetical protein